MTRCLAIDPVLIAGRRRKVLSHVDVKALSPDEFCGGHDGYPPGTYPIVRRPLAIRQSTLFGEFDRPAANDTVDRIGQCAHTSPHLTS